MVQSLTLYRVPNQSRNRTRQCEADETQAVGLHDCGFTDDVVWTRPGKLLDEVTSASTTITIYFLLHDAESSPDFLAEAEANGCFRFSTIMPKWQLHAVNMLA